MKTFHGNVIKGESRGKQLGFPTINLDLHNADLDFGVYAARVKVNEKQYWGAMHYGPRHTFNNEQPVMEVHLLDFDGDLYGEQVEVQVLKKIRDIKKFSNKEELIEQIKKDVETVRALDSNSN